MSDPVVSVVGWTIVAFSLLIARVATAAGEDDAETPSSYLARAGTGGAAGDAEGARPVICLGDSLTRGNLSANWVRQLRDQLEGTFGQLSPQVLNAGVNMHCSKNIQERLSEVIACRPSHVSILVGTNDLKAELSPVEGFLYQYFGKLTEVPTLDSYEKTLCEIREALLEAGASVAFISPPVLGEVASSPANLRAAEYAEAVRRVADGGGDRCTYVPFFERTSADLRPQGVDYCGFKFFGWLCMLCVDLHMFRRDLAEIQRERNLGVTIDLVHLGPAAAKQLTDMVAAFVSKARATTEVPTVVALQAAVPVVVPLPALALA